MTPHLQKGMLGALVFAALIAGSPSRADTPPEDRAAADALFKEGRALVKQGKYAEGCAKLAASQKLDPATGSLLALADCYELNGQTASAWTTFNEAPASARKNSDGPRADEAERRANLLDSKLSKLTVVVPKEARATGLEIRRNGKVIDAALFGSAIPVDPGEQTITLSAPGKVEQELKVTVKAGVGIIEVIIPILVDAPTQPTSTASATAMPSAIQTPSVSPSAAPAIESGLGTQRTVAIAVGGVGILGVAVGAVFGGLTFSKVGEAEDKGLCSGKPLRCTQEGLRLQNEANDLANISNITFGVGGAALITGVLLAILAPTGAGSKNGAARVTVVPSLGPSSNGLSLSGTW